MFPAHHPGCHLFVLVVLPPLSASSCSCHRKAGSDGEGNEGYLDDGRKDPLIVVGPQGAIQLGQPGRDGAGQNSEADVHLQSHAPQQSEVANCGGDHQRRYWRCVSNCMMGL